MLAVLEAWVSHTYHQVRLGDCRIDIARRIAYHNITPPTKNYTLHSAPAQRARPPSPPVASRPCASSLWS